MKKIRLHDTVALVEEIKTKKFMENEEITLRQGLVGTVVEEYNNGEAFEIEFSDKQGLPYALLTVKSEKLMPIFFELGEIKATKG